MIKAKMTAPQLRSLHRTVRGTEYIVTGTYSPTSQETAKGKIARLVLRDAEMSGIMSSTVLHTAAHEKGVQHD